MMPAITDPMWAPAKFLIAVRWSDTGMSEVAGYVYRGLGLDMRIKGSPKGRRAPTWTLTHIGSGHAVCNIVGHVKDAFPIAAEIAECSDWSFDGLTGWKNVDPDLPSKVNAIMAKYGNRISRNGRTGHSEAIASVIALARA